MQNFACFKRTQYFSKSMLKKPRAAGNCPCRHDFKYETMVLRSRNKKNYVTVHVCNETFAMRCLLIFNMPKKWMLTIYSYKLNKVLFLKSSKRNSSAAKSLANKSICQQEYISFYNKVWNYSFFVLMNTYFKK